MLLKVHIFYIFNFYTSKYCELYYFYITFTISINIFIFFKQVRTVEFQSSSSSSSSIEYQSQFPGNENIGIEDPVDLPGPSISKRRRAQKQFITPNLVAMLDRCKVSDRDSIGIITTIAQALGHNIDDLIINRTSIRRQRTKHRAELANKLREKFNDCELNAITVHWDGKLLPILKGTGKIERLPVLISSIGVEKLLGIPTISSSSGDDQASAVYDLLEEWGLSNKVQALCCDTTASNTGRYQGACVLLEQKLEREILYLPCRHHIYEIILQSVFKEKMYQSSGPNVPLFKNFQNAWPTINKLNFVSGIETQYVRQTITDTVIQETIKFSIDVLQREQQPREDYKEFLQLIIIFLGGTPPKNISFRAPGAFHHARWMAKALYCLKIYLFKHQFSITAEEETGIRDICIFLATFYIKPWIRATMTAEAPRQDLEFLQKLYAYRKIDEKISLIAVKKMCNHLWYLSTETAALAFFDKAVGKNTKLRMVEALNTEVDESCKKFTINPNDVGNYIEIGIEHFISQGSKKFFERFSIPIEFLKKDPNVWENENDFLYGLNIVQGLKVVNDTAERGVKLMQEYNQLLVKNEEEKQYILQIVSEHRKQFPDVTKQSLLKEI